MSDIKKKKRIGFYCWGGKNTIRMIKLKYFSPKIDRESLLSCYDYDYLAKLKELFGITDFWATLYWGFGDSSERSAEDFLRSKVENFKKLDIALHAYIQGSNLVTEDFQKRDIWAKDSFGNTIPYFKGRSVTCVNNPNFRELHRKRIQTAARMNVDGIYIDNIQMGQMTLSHKGRPLTFCGCSCQYCKKLFKDRYDELLPTDFDQAERRTVENYLDFRTEGITNWIGETRKIAGSKEFGTNFYSPYFDSKIVYGFDDLELTKIQDYLLYEHFIFPKKNEGSVPSIRDDILLTQKPIFSLPYKKPIGYDPAYLQEDYDRLFQVYKQSNLNLCIKGGEFTTKSVWHSLRVDSYADLNTVGSIKLTEKIKGSRVPSLISLIPFGIRTYIYTKLLRFSMESRMLRPIMGLTFKYVIR